jgi:hypothetical protein
MLQSQMLQAQMLQSQMLQSMTEFVDESNPVRGCRFDQFGTGAIVGSSPQARKYKLWRQDYQLAGPREPGSLLLLNHFCHFVQQVIGSVRLPQDSFDADALGLFDVLL